MSSAEILINGANGVTIVGTDNAAGGRFTAASNVIDLNETRRHPHRLNRQRKRHQLTTISAATDPGWVISR